MKKRRHLIIIRNTSITLSVVFFVLTAIFFSRFIISQNEIPEPPLTPVEVSHRVLFISSYNPLYFSYAPQARGLEKSLYANGIEYDVVYMYSQAHGATASDIFYKFLVEKLKSSPNYEAVLLGNNAALKFALEHQNELFPELPMIFFGVNDYELALRAAENPHIIGFYESNYLEATIELATKLFPNRKTLVALHDESTEGEADIKIFWSQKEKYKDYAFADFNTALLSQEDLISLLESLPQDSILFYMTCYNDKSGNFYSVASRTNTIVRSANVPIFRNYVGGENMGVLGGVHLDIEEQCKKVGDMLAEILAAKNWESRLYLGKSSSKTTLDYTLMKKYNLDFSHLPADTVFYNRPDTFLEHYGKLLTPISLFILALILFAVSSIFEKQIVSSLFKELQASRNDIIKREEDLRYKAEYDEVLDVYNRRTITEWFCNTMKPDDIFSVIIFDIDNFKMLNESYGHSLADSILQYLVAMIRSISAEGSWRIARFGGDEFLIIIPGERITAECESLKKLSEAIKTPIPLGDETLTITVSIGVSCSDGVTPPDQHIINAEGAMYEAKTRGKNTAIIYDEEMKKKVKEEIVIKEKLQKALNNDGFFMLYQPKVDVKSKKTNGYEALVRMKEPGIWPGQFIPLAERSGWIWRIGRITTELVIKQLAEWRENGKKLHPVSVNYSSKQLNDHSYVDFVAELLKKYDIPPRYLEIEITEGLFLEKSTLAEETFKRFKDLGIRILMDDFGTGYSSLGYLTYIPVDIIKLDKSLVDAYLGTNKDTFIKNIIHLIHDLDKEMIIEGVEEEWQFKRLREFGADTIQGYFFAKPIPANEAIDFNAK